MYSLKANKLSNITKRKKEYITMATNTPYKNTMKYHQEINPTAKDDFLAKLSQVTGSIIVENTDNTKPSFFNFYLTSNSGNNKSWFQLTSNAIYMISQHLLYTGLQCSEDSLTLLTRWFNQNRNTAGNWLVSVYPVFDESTKEYYLSFRVAITETNASGQKVPVSQITIKTNEHNHKNIEPDHLSGLSNLFPGFYRKYNITSYVAKLAYMGKQKAA
jgi:predicted small secreted protein